LRAEGFSCILDDFYEGLAIRKLQILIKKISFFSSWIFFQFLAIKTLNLDLDSNEMLDQDSDPTLLAN
jgi:hypothetical protein